MAKLTTQQYVQQLDKRLKELENADHFFPCVQGLHNEQVARIFDFGEGGSDPIGQYSTTPVYISPKISPVSFAPKGKDSDLAKQVKKTRKIFLKSLGVDSKESRAILKHTTRYFEGGYKEFRKLIGRESEFVNLDLSGDLRRDFSNSLQLKVKKWVSGVKRKYNSDKVDGSVDRFGIQTWEVTDMERGEFIDCCKRQRLKIKI